MTYGREREQKMWISHESLHYHNAPTNHPWCFVLILSRRLIKMNNKRREREMDIRVGILVIFVVVGVADLVVAQTDPIAAVCAPADYKEVCTQTLNEVAPKGTTDPKELVKASFQAIINELQAASNFSASLIPNATEPMLKKSLEVCNGLYQNAVGDLQKALSFMGTIDLQNQNNTVKELQILLSASSSYQSTCLDSVEDPKYKDMLNGKAFKANQLNTNALAIIEILPQILNSNKKA